MKQLTTDQQQLIQKLANATKTYYQAGGHGKAERNQYIANEFKKQLQEAGIEVPSDSELLAIGKFNGEGSY